MWCREIKLVVYLVSTVGLGKLIATGDTLNVKTDSICGKIV